MKRATAVGLAVLLLCGCRRHGATGSKASAPVAPPVPGVDFQQTTVSRFAEHPRLWVYTPLDKHKTHPCVFIAAAGAPLCAGKSLQPEERQKHLPYVQAGYVVVAYDISGEIPSGGGEEGERSALALFAKRDVGIQNGKAAVNYALRKLKIDPLRLYAVGDGASGTVALQLSAMDSRIRGCVAYDPVVDVAAYVGAARRAEIQSLRPPTLQAIQRFAPGNIIDSLKCPVCLVDTGEVEFQSTALKKFRANLGRGNQEIQFVDASGSGEAKTREERVIPIGIEWLGRARRK